MKQENNEFERELERELRLSKLLEIEVELNSLGIYNLTYSGNNKLYI